MISAVAWLPRGAAKSVPQPAPLTEEELAAIKDQAVGLAAGVLAQDDDDDDADDASGSSSSWETDGGGRGGGGSDDDGGDDEMDVDAAVARAREVARAMAPGKAAAAAEAAAAAAAGKGGSRGGKKGGSAAAAATAAPTGLEAALADLDMEHYDDDGDDDGGDDDEGGGGGAAGGSGRASAAVIARVLGGRSAGIVLDDPYLQGGDSSDEGDEALAGVDSDERDDYVLTPDDLLILAARSEDDVSTVEVWVYEEAGARTGGEANLYVHHDVMLPALPLALAWLDFHPLGGSGGGGDAGRRGNLVAVGAMDPGIEVWDLDVADAVEPVATLGGYGNGAAAAAAGGDEDDDDGDDEDEGGSGKKKSSSSSSKAASKKKKQKAKKKKKAAAAAAAEREPLPGSHTGPVLGLAWNRAQRNVLASGSADATVKVWDLEACACAHTLAHHAGKVQAVAWNPAEAPVLLSGSFDKTAALADVRTPDGKAASWRVSADVEALAWNPHTPTSFVVSAEDGLVAAFDARGGAGSKPLFRLAAHNKPTCALSFCPAAPGLLATASTDKQAKLWDVSANKPALLASQDPKLGAIFTAAFCGDVPHLLALAGAKGSVGVWDVRSCGAVAAKWPALLRDVVAAGGGDEGNGA